MTQWETSCCNSSEGALFGEQSQGGVLDSIHMDIENLIDRVRTSMMYMPISEVACYLIDMGVPAEDVFLAVHAAKILERHREQQT